MYRSYASYYDQGQMRFSVLMHGYLRELLERYPPPVSQRRMIDLACGTGTLALLMAEDGWDVLGIDLSVEMLRVAQRKARSGPLAGSVRFRRGDMRTFDVTEQVELITCFYDSLNYLLEEQELLQTFENVREALVPGGLWIFDMNTPYFLQHVWSSVEVDEWPGYLQVMQSHFNAERCISTLALTGFIADDGGLYERFDEVHAERGYERAVVERLLAQAGLTLMATYSAFTTYEPDAESHRLVWVAGRPRMASGDPE